MPWKVKLSYRTFYVIVSEMRSQGQSSAGGGAAAASSRGDSMELIDMGRKANARLALLPGYDHESM